MSYDLMVFDPDVAPRERAAFMEWYEQSPFESDTQILNDPEICASNLRNWYNAIVPKFPDYNSDDFDDDRIEQVGDFAAGYSIGRSAIYVDFRWTVAEEAYDAVRRLAVEHNVGFYDVSGDDGTGEIYFPGEALRPESGGMWREIAADFRAGDLSKYTEQAEQPKHRWFDFFRRRK